MGIVLWYGANDIGGRLRMKPKPIHVRLPMAHTQFNKNAPQDQPETPAGTATAEANDRGAARGVTDLRPCGAPQCGQVRADE